MVHLERRAQVLEANRPGERDDDAVDTVEEERLRVGVRAKDVLVDGE